MRKISVMRLKYIKELILLLFIKINNIKKKKNIKKKDNNPKFRYASPKKFVKIPVFLPIDVGLSFHILLGIKNSGHFVSDSP